MRQRKKLRNELEDINITPVMDIVFLILIYFFVCGGNSFKNQINKENLTKVKKSVVSKTENRKK